MQTTTPATTISRGHPSPAACCPPPVTRCLPPTHTNPNTKTTHHRQANHTATHLPPRTPTRRQRPPTTARPTTPPPTYHQANHAATYRQANHVATYRHADHVATHHPPTVTCRPSPATHLHQPEHQYQRRHRGRFMTPPTTTPTTHHPWPVARLL